eukprot:TRINITY_DN953_c0_g1_i3.p3 TRINITY_DN953_c0_g1~~TRINITY_DN953_c0_g1_i3.p3  ORF type:complete len:159 (+),score=47.98 TRINITY_DN953_c0_g1_i3:119-595(+)
MIRRPPRSTHCISSAASDVYKRQGINAEYMGKGQISKLFDLALEKNRGIMSKYQQLDEEQTQIEIFKTKRLIKRLDECKGAHTSMVTIVTPPTKSLNETTKLLADEIGSSMSIKDKTNKQSVNDAITYALNKIKLYKNTPPTGLVIFFWKSIGKRWKE